MLWPEYVFLHGCIAEPETLIESRVDFRILVIVFWIQISCLSCREYINEKVN